MEKRTGMADQKINIIIQAQDKASAAFNQLRNNMKASGQSAKSFATDFAPLIATGALVAAALWKCVEAANQEEQAITDGARAAAKAVGSFEVAKEAITELNIAMEEQGFETQDTAQAFQLLVNSGRSVEQAMSDTANILAYAEAKHISVQKAVKILLREEGEFAEALKDKRTELDATNDKITEYSDSIEELNKQLGISKSEERALRDLNTDKERATTDLADAQEELREKMNESNDDVLDAQRELAKIRKEPVKNAEDEIRKQERLETATERLNDAIKRKDKTAKDGAKDIERANQRITDIDTNIADKNEDIKDRQQEVNDKITQYTEKLDAAKTAAGDLTTQIDSLKLSQDKEIETIKEANLIRGESVTGMEKQKDAANKVETAMEKIGVALRPATDSLLDQIIVAFEWLAGKDPVGDFFKRIGVVVSASGALLSIAIETFVVGPIKTAFTDFITDVQAKWDTFWTALLTAVTTTAEKIKTNIETFITNITTAFTNFVKNAVAWGTDLINNFAKGIEEAIAGISGWIANIIKGVTATIQIETTGGATGLVAQGVRPLAAGGIITSPTMALLGEGGENEYVIPESKMKAWMGGNKGATVNYYIYEQKNARLLAGEIGKELLNVLGSSSGSSIASSVVN